jgi:hypothetical protein
MKRWLTALLAGLTVFGTTFAFAATLGGVTSGAVGANSAVVAACDSDGVTTSYDSAWDAADERYEVSDVTVLGVSDSCDGGTLKVSLQDSGGVQLAEATAAIPTSVATSFTLTPATTPSVAAVEAVEVIIAS